VRSAFRGSVLPVDGAWRRLPGEHHLPQLAFLFHLEHRDIRSASFF
jgi:hypothetical protein